MVVAPVFCGRFIGRRAELELLSERLREASCGQGSLVLIAGDAGIGKTRFLEAAQTELEPHGARFAVGQCLRYAASPLGPVAQALRTLHEVAPAVLEASPRLRAALARVVPEFATGDAPLAGGDDPRAYYEAIGDALRRFGDVSPCIVAIEDVHWSDRATLEFLEYAAEQVARRRVVLAVTYRADELRLDHPLAVALSRLGRRGAWRIDLQPLSGNEMRLFAADALAGQDAVRAERIAEALAIADGNPLFAEELLRECVDRDVLALPLSVRAAVLERVATLDEDDRAVLGYAAVIGRRFDVAVLAELTGRPVAAIAKVLRAARDLQVVFAEPGASDTYVFRHAVMQEALYGELLPTETRALHARIARRLEEVDASDDDTIVQLAHHWRAAGEPEKTVAYNAAAGDIAGRRLAHHDAVRFYERALACVMPDAPGEGELHEKLGKALSYAEPGHRALRAFEVALRRYEAAGRGERAVEVLLAMSRQYFHLCDPDGTRRTAEHAIRIARASSNRDLELAALTTMLGCFVLAGDADGVVPYDQAADALVASGAQPRSAFFNYRALLAMLRGSQTAMYAHHRRAIALAETDPNPYMLPTSSANVAATIMFLGDLERAVQTNRTAIRLAEERFVAVLPSAARANCAQALFVMGRLDEARRMMDDAEIDATRAPYVRMHLGYLAVMMGLLTDDAALIDRFANDELVELAFRCGQAQRIEPTVVAYAELAAAHGDRDRAVAMLRRGARAVRSVHQHFSLPIAIARFGIVDEVPRMRALLERWARTGDNPLGEGLLVLFEALVARSPSAARRHADEAVHRFRALGARWYEAQAEEAAERPERAYALYREMGAVREARRLEAIAVPRNRVGRAKNELTRREREIAEHVARGLSNRAIADALVLSERTVETHVASILAKLEVTSRAGVAAHLMRASG